MRVELMKNQLLTLGPGGLAKLYTRGRWSETCLQSTGVTIRLSVQDVRAIRHMVSGESTSAGVSRIMIHTSGGKEPVKLVSQ